MKYANLKINILNLAQCMKHIKHSQWTTPIKTGPIYLTSWTYWKKQKQCWPAKLNQVNLASWLKEIDLFSQLN